MTVKVRINSPDNIAMFKSMNKYLVDGYNRTPRGIIPNLGDHRANFERAHRVKIHVDGHGNWSHIEFASPHDYLLAMLRWTG